MSSLEQLLLGVCLSLEGEKILGKGERSVWDGMCVHELWAWEQMLKAWYTFVPLEVIASKLVQN